MDYPYPWINCCQFWKDRGYNHCKGCQESNKAWNKYQRELKDKKEKESR